MTDDGSPRLSDARSFTVTVAAAVPVLVGSRRVYSGTGPRRKLIGVELDFSAPLDALVASAVAHFRVTQPGATPRSAAKVVRVRSASYDPASRSIRLTLASFDIRKPLTVRMTGLVGATGLPMASLTATT